MSVLTLWWVVPLWVLCILALTAALNAFTFPRLQPHIPHQLPSVSVLIPARNEADVIGRTVNQLLRQEPALVELLVLDDESTDGTAEVAMAAAQGDERLRVIRGRPLPQGWGGKNWACHQLSEAASGEVFIFTDADVRWAAGGLGAVLNALEEHGADMLTVWPTQHTETWAERLVVPLMGFVIIGYLPEIAVRYLPVPLFAAANGQCLVFRRGVYEAVGGHVAVRGSIIEDVSLAQTVKRMGHKLVMTDGSDLVSCHMYTGWSEVREGFAKNILAGHASSVAFLVFSTVFHWVLFVVPWVWLGVGWLWADRFWPLVPGVMAALGLGIRVTSAVVTRQRIRDALLMPVSVVLMTIIAARSLGRVEWKGRTVKEGSL
jgi:chlorobactene glucosyltransferase